MTYGSLAQTPGRTERIEQQLQNLGQRPLRSPHQSAQIETLRSPAKLRRAPERIAQTQQLQRRQLGTRSGRERGDEAVATATHMVGTLVEISGQKRWTTELRLASACSFSSGAGSCSIARSPLAELTVATAAMAALPSVRRRRRRGGARVWAWRVLLG